MIEKLGTNGYDTRPQVIIEKLNEVIDWINEFVAANMLSAEAEDERGENSSVVEDVEPSNVNSTND